MIFASDIVIYGTVYVRAKTKKEATAKAKALRLSALEVDEQEGGEIDISGLPLDSPDLPDVSLSPAMTIGKLTGPMERR